jgi:hypothetical protein
MNNLFNNTWLDVSKKHQKSNCPLINKEHLEILYGLALGDLYIYLDIKLKMLE